MEKIWAKDVKEGDRPKSVFLVARKLLGISSPPKSQPVRQLPLSDPYYDAAMRELDVEMGVTRGR